MTSKPIYIVYTVRDCVTRELRTRYVTGICCHTLLTSKDPRRALRFASNACYMRSRDVRKQLKEEYGAVSVRFTSKSPLR